VAADDGAEAQAQLLSVSSGRLADTFAIDGLPAMWAHFTGPSRSPAGPFASQRAYSHMPGQLHSSWFS
jgi:hypothetical protein